MSTWQKIFGLILGMCLISGYQGRARASERFELKDGTVIVGDIVDVGEDTFAIKSKFGKVSIRRDQLRPKEEGGAQPTGKEEISKISEPEIKKEAVLQKFREERLWMKASKVLNQVALKGVPPEIESQTSFGEFKIVKGKDEKEIGEVVLLQLTGDIEGAKWLKEKRDSVFLWELLGIGICIGGGVMEVAGLWRYDYRLIIGGPVISGVGVIIWWWNASQESYYRLSGAEAIRLIIKSNKELGEKMGVSTDYIVEVPLFRF